MNDNSLAAESSERRELAAALMDGAYDLHVHSSPSVFKRALDGMDLVKAGDRAGMAGILLKSHYEPTALRASLINQYSGCRKTKAYGGLALNWPVGGLNPYAVEEAVRAGAVIIWMPTRDAANSLVYGNMEGDFFGRPGISVLKEDGTLKDSVLDIFEIVKKKGVFLATGHLFTAESILLCREGRKMGVNMILTHPEFPRTSISSEVQRDLAKIGVLIEHNWLNLAERSVSPEKMAANIRLAGVRNCFLSTDRGQLNAPCAVDELRRFIEVLLGQGFTEKELRTMVQMNPGRIVSGS